MATDKEQLTTVKKEMGITHKEFYGELPTLLKGIPYHQSKNTLTFQYNHKSIEIVLEQEGVREISCSVRLPVTPVTIRFHDCSEEVIGDFVKRFNLRFMKGGG